MIDARKALLLPTILVFCTLSSFGQQDLTVYDEALRNGWQNWSWATANLASPTLPHGGTSCVSVTASAYQGFYLHHDAFDSRQFTNLTFWIRGAANGAILSVQATLNGVAQTMTNLPALTTSWTPHSISLATLGVTNKQNLDGFWIQAGGSSVTFYVDDIKFTALPAPALVQVQVTATQTVRTVDARFFGLNAAIWDAVFDTTNTVGLLRELDNRTLRFPGGSLSDEYHWRSNTTGTNTWQWSTSFTNFMRVATNTGAQAFITVNYGSGTAAEAADWVRWANVSNGMGFTWWEVGNENYGAWETDTNARPNDAFTYATRFKDYATLMKAADPAIKVGAVAVVGEDAFANYADHPATNTRTLAVHNGWTPVMLATMKSLGVTPDFLIYHRYAQAPGAENDSLLLQSAATWADDAADLRRQLADYLGVAATNVELVCTENNSVYTSPGKQSTSLVNGLFLADSVAQAMQTEFRSVLWWDLRNAQEGANNNSASLHGWRNYGDYGITDGSNPSTAVNRYPTFFAAKLLKYFARGGDRVVKATSDYPLLSVYAAARTNGFLSLLVINKSATNTLNASIVVHGFGVIPNAPVFAYGLPQDAAASTNFAAGAGLVVTSTVSAGTNFNHAFGPYSVTVLALAGGDVVGLEAAGAATNGVNLRIRGLPDLRYLVQASTNLVGWSPLFTNTLSGESAMWLDTNAVHAPFRFYRSWWLK